MGDNKGNEAEASLVKTHNLHSIGRCGREEAQRRQDREGHSAGGTRGTSE